MSENPSSECMKATSQLTIFMRRMRAKGKIQRNNYQYGQRGLSFVGKNVVSFFDRILARTKNR